MNMSTLLVAVLAVALLHTAYADTFPFARCEVADTKTPVGTALDVVKNGNTYCFTIEKDSSCTGSCCNMDVAKFDIQVHPSCKDGTTVHAEVNGKPMKAIFAVPPNAPDYMTLKVDQLGLTLDEADGTEICLTLDGTCANLDDLCVLKGLKCQTALTSSNHLCCPVSRSGVRCPICINFEIADPPAEPSYTFDAADCKRYQAITEAAISNLLTMANMTFEFNASTIACTDTKMSFCSPILEPAVQKLAPAIEEYAPTFFKTVMPSCPVAADGLTFQVVVDSAPGYDCIFVKYGEECSLPKPNFPFCECVTREGATPFALSPTSSKEPGSKEGTTAYCFDVTTVTPDNEGTCGTTTTLKKVEFYASQDLKWELAGVTINTKKGSSKGTVAWGAKSSGDYDTLKVTNLGWSVDQVASLSPSICLELKDSTQLFDFCLGGACWATLFDPTQTCCPLYPSGP